MGAAALLTISRNGETIKTCPIEGEAMLGRADGCVIRLEDRAISRQHATFRVVGDGVQIEKKSEFAPLMINGAEMSTRAIVKDADVISIGPYLMRITMAKAAERTAPLTPPPVETEALAEVTAALDAPIAPAEEVQPPALDAPGNQAVEASGIIQGFGEAAPLESVVPDENPPSQAGSFEGLNIQAAMDAASSERASSESDPFASNGQAQLSVPAVVEEPLETAHEDERTKLAPSAKLNVRLVFPDGLANVTDFEVTQDEVSIGRGKDCDIILNDKKSSRKNAILRRAGLTFSIKDLDSANGTFVNGVRVKEQELHSDDLIRIGAVEFQFKAFSADYAEREKGFMSVPESFPAEEPQALSNEMQLMDPGMQEPQALQMPGVAPAPDPAAAPVNIPGITGIGPADIKRMGFIEKLRNFKQLPRKQQITIGLIVVFLVYFIFIDEDAPEKKAPAKKAPTAQASPLIDKGMKTFAMLSPEQQRFVQSEYQLAFDYFKNKEYDKSLFELQRIFDLIQDYKDSREIERYAKEGKRKLEAFEEEKRKKEEEARLKAKIQSLVDECKERMDHKDYEQAKELFAQIVVLDPDNQQIAAWKKEIDDYEEKNRLDAQSKMVQGEINNHAWEVYKEGMALKKQGHYHSAIEVFSKVGDIGASDKKVVSMAAQQIRACRGAIKAARDPVLAEAQTLETAGELSKAFGLYKKATRIDPPHPAGYAGMNRIRGILHERAKLVYTEAVLAESYSDFATAKKKFTECKEMAPSDDIYHERAERKLARYFRKEDQQP